jgi:hypothetical protein
LALKIWNLGGGLDWAALGIMIDLYGISDPELLINQLATIRDFMRD